MQRRTFLMSALTALVLATGAAAQSLTDRIVEQLRSQGFNEIEVTRTLLGRSRILARSPIREREIIVNPRTGEILRDYWEDRGGGGSIYYPDDDYGGNSGHGGGSDDDDDDDDNSGPGGNSGHGGG